MFYMINLLNKKEVGKMKTTRLFIVNAQYNFIFLPAIIFDHL